MPLADKTLKALSPKRIAEELDCHPNTVYKLMDSGELPSFHVGSSRRVMAADLDAFIAKGGAR